MILPKAILEAPRLGCLNLHASLLPRWRGAAPIQRAIMAGDAETGVAVMKMEEGLDTGPVAMVERVPIGPEMTAGELHDALARLGADLMGRALAALARGALTFTPQGEDGVTYAQQDHERGGAHRLGEAGAGRARPHPRPLAVSGRLLHGRPRPGRGTGQGAARGARRRQRRTGPAPRRRRHGRLRRTGGAPARGPARRTGRRVRRRSSCAARGFAPASGSPEHAPLQARHRI